MHHCWSRHQKYRDRDFWCLGERRIYHHVVARLLVCQSAGIGLAWDQSCSTTQGRTGEEGFDDFQIGMTWLGIRLSKNKKDRVQKRARGSGSSLGGNGKRARRDHKQVKTYRRIDYGVADGNISVTFLFKYKKGPITTKYTSDSGGGVPVK